MLWGGTYGVIIEIKNTIIEIKYTYKGTVRPGALQSMGSQRVRHDLVTEQQQQNTQSWNHPPIPVHGKIVFHETGPWCQKGWGSLSWKLDWSWRIHFQEDSHGLFQETLGPCQLLTRGLGSMSHKPWGQLEGFHGMVIHLLSSQASRR